MVGVAAVAVAAASAPAGTQQLRADELLAIGSHDGPYALTAVGSVVLSESGHVFVAQPQDGAVRVFDSAGAAIRTFGRNGEGPGEYRRVGRVGFHGSELWVSDPALRRITFLSPEGAVLRTVAFRPTAVPDGVMVGPADAVLSDGSLLATPVVTPSILERSRAQPLMRFDAGGRYLGTLASLTYEPFLSTIRSGDRVVSFRQPLVPSWLYSTAPGGEFFAAIGYLPSSRDRDVALLIGSPGGSGVHVVPLPPGGGAAISSVKLARARETLQENFARAGLPRAVARQLARDSLRLPAALFDRIVAGEDGIVWLRSMRETTDGVVWLAYHTRAQQFATLQLPHNVEIRQSRAGLVAAVREDELQVQQVVIYRVSGW